MTLGNEKTIRGRPKTLNRDNLLEIAMMSYWTEGATALSIGEVCQRAGVSKPSVYREFGSDDGFKAAVLNLYRQNVLKRFYEVLEIDRPFDQTLDAIIEFTVQDREALGVPQGCLFVSMRERKNEFGELTRAVIREIKNATMRAYVDCVNRAKTNGQFDLDILPNSAARYFDAQNRNAMMMQKESVNKSDITEYLELSFLPFRKPVS